MNTLYQTIYGSRLYGTDTPDSDKDYKAVFLPELDELLLGYRVKNSVKTTGSTGKNTKDDIDFEHIPLQVLMDDFVKGQTYAIEIVFSAISTGHDDKIFYDIRFKSLCEELACTYLTSNVQAMVGYAYGQAQKYGLKGKRLKALETFIAECEKYSDTDKLEVLNFDLSFVDNTNLKASKYQATDDISAPCFEVLGKVYPCDITIKTAINRAKKQAERYGHRAKKAKEDDGVDWKALHHAVRISEQAVRILKNCWIEFPMGPIGQKYHRDIKEGKVDFDEVTQRVEELLDEIDKEQLITELPERDEKFNEDFREFKLKWLRRFYLS